LRVRTLIRDLFALPSERPLKPARALSRKLPEIEE